MKKIIISGILILTALLSSCAGSKAVIKLEDLKYPASMSAYIYNSQGKILSVGSGLNKIGNWKFKKKFWSIGYSYLDLSGDSEVAESMNAAIREANGTGIVNFKAESERCGYSYIPIFPILPVFPECIDVKFEGDIVK